MWCKMIGLYLTIRAAGRRWLPFSVLAFVLFSCGIAGAASQVDARLDTTIMRIGDSLNLTLTVRTEKGETVGFPDLAGSLGKFELLSARPQEKYVEDDSSKLERQSFKITTFETGSQAIPRLAFPRMHADGSVDTLHTAELSVTVLSLLTDTTASEVKPLKALLGVAKRWHTLAFWAIVALAVLTILVITWRRYLARRDARFREMTRPLAPSQPAHLTALDELERIKSLGLIEKGEIKLFHILISEAIRKYLSARFEIEALDMTTWEIEFVLEDRLPADGALGKLIGGFLEACDLVKFAKYKPPLVEINSVFNRAYEIVEKFRPEALQVPVDSQAQLPALAGTGPESHGAPVNKDNSDTRERKFES